jgi:DNA helicase-2/ATP-dependent DNA helicase PcrA
MRQRVVSLLAHGFPPESIVAITFNIGAGEGLKRRVEESGKAHPQLGPNFLDQMCNDYTGTLHTYAFQLLQRHVPKFETYDVSCSVGNLAAAIMAERRAMRPIR